MMLSGTPVSWHRDRAMIKAADEHSQDGTVAKDDDSLGQMIVTFESGKPSNKPSIDWTRR